MSEDAASAPALVLIKYRARRLYNALTSSFSKKRGGKTQRTANARKGSRSWLTTGFFLLFFVVQYTFQAYSLTNRTEEFFGEDTAALTIALNLELLLLFVSTFLMNIASKEITTPEWDLEWLVTLPIPRNKLIAIRLIERSVVNATGLLFFWPFISILFWHELSWIAIPVAFFATVAILFFESVLRTLVDTGLRLVVSPSSLRNFQAIASLVAGITMISLVSILINAKPILFDWSLSPGFNWTRWTPVGLVAGLREAATFSAIASNLVLLGSEVALAYLCSSRILSRLLRYGVVAGGSREAVKRVVLTETGSDVTKLRRSIFTPLQRRELKLLSRDRNFMIQTLLLPIFITGMQFFLGRSDDWTTTFKSGFTTLAATSFGAAAYSMMFSALQVLNTENKSLWILYTIPKRLEFLLREKVVLWLAVALLYPVVIFGIGISFVGMPDLKSAALIFIVLAGILIYGTVAACFGVFASDPLAEDPRQRSRLDYNYLFMLLAGFYTYAIFAESYWTKLTLLILSILMALALYQKARDYLPYLLDPMESPKSSVALSDGLIAAMIFFVLQGVTAALFSRKGQEVDGRLILIAFSVAGALTFLSMRLIYWRKKTAGVPRIFGRAWVSAVMTGMLSGLGAGAVGITYIKFITNHGYFSEVLSKIGSQWIDGKMWFLALSVVAAPLFEEFIFRGIIFRGLRRTWNLQTAALASAAIFAIIHPPVAVVPVFCLAVIAALGYARTGLLLTPIITHATYNFMVHLYQTDILKL